MSPSEDVHPSRCRWVEWWFAPRWRALMTWLALVWIESAVRNFVGWTPMDRLNDWPINWVAGLAHLSVPPMLILIAREANRTVLASWFEPLALRLNLVRGLAWVALRIVANIANTLLSTSAHFAWGIPIAWLLRAAALGLVLIGWRTRPWMCVPAAALAFGIVEFRVHSSHNSWAPWWNVAVELPLAVAMLYGTRLLKPTGCTRESD